VAVPGQEHAGEELKEAFLGLAGACGGRIYAFRSPAVPKGFFCHTRREQEQILLGCPEYIAAPPNLPEDEATLHAALSVYSDPNSLNA